MIKNIAGPAFIPNSAANIYTPPAATIYTVIHHIHFCNVTGAAATFSLYIGATGASASGTEIFKDYPIPAKGVYDYWCERKMLSTDFLVGVSNTASAITIEVEGEQEIV